MLLLAAPPQQAVESGGGDQEHRRRRSREERDEVHAALEVGRLAEAVREGDGEEEAEQHLHARQGDTELVQKLDQLAVEPIAILSHGASVPGVAGAETGRRLSRS